MPAEIRKVLSMVKDNIVTVKIKPLLNAEKKNFEILPHEPKKFEFTDKLDEEGNLTIPDMIKKSARISVGFTVAASIEHVLKKEEKRKVVYKFEFIDKMDPMGRLIIPDMIKKPAGIKPGNVVSVRLKHVLDSEDKPVERLMEIDKFDFSSKVDDNGCITVPDNVKDSVPITPGSIVTVKIEQVLD